MNELEQKIIEWANERGLIKHTKEQALAQLAKTEEEVNELLEAIAKFQGIEETESPLDAEDWSDDLSEAHHQIQLESGDVLVTLVIQCAIWRSSLEVCILNNEFLLDDFAYPTYLKWIREDLTKYSGILDERTLQTSIERYIGGLVVEVKGKIAPYGLSLEECLEAAYQKIRDRKGETVNGVFVKEKPAA